MADNGLEWLHRMLQEPRRLGHRYLVGNSEFIALLAKEMLIQRIKKQVTE
jgi:N-acetylglucosaminyldiphosphoundecaprenol N-acetyl-beta-D-mannosaminyltransferase